MIIIKDEIFEKTNKWNDDSVYIITDFDKTLTSGSSDSSWGILARSDMVPKEYSLERFKLYNYYRPYELDQTIEFNQKNKLMSMWWSSHIDLLIKYKISEEVVNMAVQNTEAIIFRKGAKEFLKNMNDRNIPVIILSAGIGNFIEKLLIKNNCRYDNIYILSNFIKFESGIISGVTGEVIHSLNKNIVGNDSVNKVIMDRKNAILMGDSISDLNMLSGNERKQALKIGFLEDNIDNNRVYFEQQFDVVCINNVGYDELSEKVKILGKKI